jgi:hypothetical protein
VPPEIVELPEAPQAPRKEAPKTAEVKEMVEDWRSGSKMIQGFEL